MRSVAPPRKKGRPGSVSVFAESSSCTLLFSFYIFFLALVLQCEDLGSTNIPACLASAASPSPSACRPSSASVFSLFFVWTCHV